MTFIIFLIYALILLGGLFTDFPFTAIFVMGAILVSAAAFVWTRTKLYLFFIIALLHFAGIKLILSSGMFKGQGMSNFSEGFLSVATSTLWVFSGFVLLIGTHGALMAPKGK